MDHMMGVLVLVFSFVISEAPARAQDDDGWHPPPDHLTVGYEEEGKVDASPKACEAFVRDMVEWTEDEVQRGIAEVCAARKRHIEAYAALQKSYSELMTYAGQDHRLSQVEAAKNLGAMVKACIDHKSNLTTGGHNIRLDIIPNDIAAACLKLGKELLDAESDWFKVGFTESRPAP